MRNEMIFSFSSKSENESFARTTVASFVSQLNPTLEELMEIKTVVSEAVTNAIIHGYHEDASKFITIHCVITAHKELELTIEDEGVGMDHIDRMMEPLFTSKPSLERSGMGFTIMESFMDHVEVFSEVNIGTSVKLRRKLSLVKPVFQ
ncbi:MAG TPA: anti-sigma F factor [Pseudogracilibacillus sp.]|nr:anti-sigma F factor [Pseudogracilibacillus sp.]